MTASDVTSSDNIGVAHVVEIKELYISNHATQNVDIRAAFTDINIESSIFDPGIRGSILVYDAHSMLTRLPILGEEKLKISYSTPGNFTKEGEYYIWKVTDETPDDKGTSSTYRLHFCSPEILNNAKSLVGKSYSQTDDVYSIIKSIHSEYLQSKKELSVGSFSMKDPSRKVAIPLIKPFQAIEMLNRRAYSGDAEKSDYYLYFERTDKWHLKMLDEITQAPLNVRNNEDIDSLIDTIQTGSLIDKLKKIPTVYTYSSARYQEDGETAKDIRRIITLQINSRFNSIEKIREGMYDNETILYSVNDKSIKGETHDGFNQWKTTIVANGKKTNTQKFASEFEVPNSGYAGSQAPKTFYMFKNPDHKEDAVLKAGRKYQSTKVGMNQIQLTIVVPGDTAVDVGDMVEVIMPKFESVLDKGELDGFINGFYIVGALRDSILTPNKHVMTLDLYRDGFTGDIKENQLFEENS